MTLEIVYNGQLKGYLNESLIRQQALTPEKVEKIKKLHLKKWEIFEEMENETSKELLKSYAQLVETIEYELQNLWGFSKDKNFHEWYKVPHCKCPKVDNEERKGTPYRVISQYCLIHQ